MMTTMIWSHPTLTPKKRMVLVSKKGGKFTLALPYHKVPIPTTTSSRPMVATTLRVAVAGSRMRANSSRPRPSMGERTNKTRSAAQGQGIPCSLCKK